METKPTKLIVDLDPEEFGVESTSALEIQSLFSPVLDTLVELEKVYNEIVVKPITELVCAEAKELLKQYVKARTTTSKIHTEIKADILKKGRFIDGWKNTQILATKNKEENLKNLSEHFENIKKEEVLKIQTERSNELLKYEITQIPHDLGNMDIIIWENLLRGVKQSFEQKQKEEKERKLEGEVLRKSEEKKLEIQRKENEKIRAEAETSRKKLEAENEKIKAEAETSRKKLEAENKKIKAEAEAEKNKLEAENLKIKIEAEEKNKKIVEENRKLQKPLTTIFSSLSPNTDNYRFEALINKLTETKNFKFEDEKNKKINIGVSIMVDKIINYINTKK